MKMKVWYALLLSYVVLGIIGNQAILCFGLQTCCITTHTCNISQVSVFILKLTNDTKQPNILKFKVLQNAGAICTCRECIICSYPNNVLIYICIWQKLQPSRTSFLSFFVIISLFCEDDLCSISVIARRKQLLSWDNSNITFDLETTGSATWGHLADILTLINLSLNI